MHSLVGLTRNHLNVIGRSCPGGLPEEHKVAILAAAKHLSPGEQAGTAAQSASTPPSASSQPNLAAAADQQAAAPRKGTNRPASHALDSSISSCTSFASDSESDTSLGASRGSIARQALQQAPSRLAGPGKPAPTQSQLQALYSEMEADYKRLQDRSAQSRASSHPPLQAGTAQAPTSDISAVAAPNRQGKRPSPTVASLPPAKGKVSAVSLLGLAPIQIAAGIPPSAAGLQQAKASAPGKANRSSQPSKLVTGRFPSAAEAEHGVNGSEGGLQGAGNRITGVAANQGGERKASGSEVQRVSAAAVVRQMRKQKRALPEEPFVQVFTNFHTLSKVTKVLFVEMAAASVHWMSVTMTHLVVEEPA